MKHIDLWYHFIHLCVDNGSFALIWVPSHSNIADILMKALLCPAFDSLQASIGLLPH